MQITLVSSSSKVLLEQKIEELIGNNYNVVKYNYQDTTLTDVLEEASYVSLFDEMKCLVVKNADFFGKDKLKEKEEELFLHYLEQPYPCTTLIFATYEAIDKRKSITKKMIDKYKVIELAPPKNYELTNEVKKRVSMYQINDLAIKYLCDACLGNYDLIMNEISKFGLYYKKGDAITIEDLKSIVASNMNDNMFKFIDAVIKRDLQESIRLLEDFFGLKTDALQLISMLIREYRQMYYYKILEKKKYSLREVMSSLKLQEWQATKLIKNCANYHKDDLKDYLLQLADMDYKIKSGQADKNMLLYQFLVEIMEY